MKRKDCIDPIHDSEWAGVIPLASVLAHVANSSKSITLPTTMAAGNHQANQSNIVILTVSPPYWKPEDNHNRRCHNDIVSISLWTRSPRDVIINMKPRSSMSSMLTFSQTCGFDVGDMSTDADTRC